MTAEKILMGRKTTPENVNNYNKKQAIAQRHHMPILYPDLSFLIIFLTFPSFIQERYCFHG